MKRTPPFAKNRLAVVLALAGLYTLFSVGIIKATHFCMGSEASVAYFTAEPEKCACSLFADQEDHCCSDSRDLVKLENSQKHLSTFKLPVPALTFIGELYWHVPLVSPDGASPLLPPVNADAQIPPKILFKLHCSFVFYEANTLA